MALTEVAEIKAEELHELLTSTAEIALLDVREPVETGNNGSILLAVSSPYSRLELTLERALPRRDVPIVVFDEGSDELAHRAASRLVELGYRNVKVLFGGIESWASAGYKVHYGGPNVGFQAFGEFVEEKYETPHITVEDFLARRARNEEVVLLDSRPIAEFVNHSLPGGTSVPGAELVYRAGELIPSDEALVVVHCAGRTRSILGAQVLINAGIPNRVVALEGGTMSWVLEGHELEHGRAVQAPVPTGEALEKAKRASSHMASRFDVNYLDEEGLKRFRSESDSRTLYLLDIRDPEEYRAGHLKGSWSTPSWEVVPGLFRHIAVRNARIVLIDGGDNVRATVVASWLNQMGVGEIYVLEGGIEGRELETGVEPSAAVVPLGIDDVDVIEVRALKSLLDSGEAIVLDLQLSSTYRANHIPGAYFAIRSRLAGALSKLPGDGRIVLTSEDGLVAKLTAKEAEALTDRDVSALVGGNESWHEAGFELESGEGSSLDAPDDVWNSAWAHDDEEQRKQAFRDYLSWELSLPAALDEDSTTNYRVFS